MGVDHVLSEVHVTVAAVAVPVSSTRASGVVRAAPVALLQLVLAMTPALSVAAIDVLLPTKLMLMLPGAAAAASVTASPDDGELTTSDAVRTDCVSRTNEPTDGTPLLLRMNSR